MKNKLTKWGIVAYTIGIIYCIIMLIGITINIFNYSNWVPVGMGACFVIMLEGLILHVRRLIKGEY